MSKRSEKLLIEDIIETELEGILNQFKLILENHLFEKP